MTFLTKRVETSDAYQKLAAEALEVANKENVALKDRVGDLNSRVFDLIEEVEMGRREAESTRSKAEKRYIVNFHLTDAY